MLKKSVFLVFLVVIINGITLAHQPRIISEITTKVQNPEVSQAFYGELTGEPAYFEINSDTAFSLYVGVLVPDLPDIKKDISSVVYKGDKDGTELFTLDGINFKWIGFYEEFAGDNYFSGPEHKQEAEPGKYTIRVFSPENRGKYVLVVGEKEEFPVNEIVNTVVTLPQIKQDFFGKFFLSAFVNKIGLFIFGPVILIAGVIIVAIYLWKKFGKRDK